MKVLETKRLVLRRWALSDVEAFAALCADPRVMEFFPKTLTREESAALIARIEMKTEQHGFGFWACELKETGACIGFIGLNVPDFEAPFLPGVEIGWRLAHEHWGKGLAPEGARAALDYGFRTLGLQEILSFTALINERSMRVMEKIGMRRDLAGDFDHPRVEDGHSLKRHVLYRIARGT